MNTDVADIFPVIDWNTAFDLANIPESNITVHIHINRTRFREAGKSTHAFNCPPNGRFVAIKVVFRKPTN
jgi:hypothetical protein